MCVITASVNLRLSYYENTCHTNTSEIQGDL